VDEWSAPRPGRFTPGERSPGTHWIGGWVGPRAGLDDVKRKLFLPGLELRTVGRSAPSQLLYRLWHPVSFSLRCILILFPHLRLYSKRLCVHFFSRHAYYISRQSYFRWFDCHNCICCTLMKLRTVWFLPSSCYFLFIVPNILRSTWVVIGLLPSFSCMPLETKASP
jgi:hypothetical protein